MCQTKSFFRGDCWSRSGSTEIFTEEHLRDIMKVNLCLFLNNPQSCKSIRLLSMSCCCGVDALTSPSVPARSSFMSNVKDLAECKCGQSLSPQTLTHRPTTLNSFTAAFPHRHMWWCPLKRTFDVVCPCLRIAAVVCLCHSMTGPIIPLLKNDSLKLSSPYTPAGLHHCNVWHKRDYFSMPKLHEPSPKCLKNIYRYTHKWCKIAEGQLIDLWKTLFSVTVSCMRAKGS